MKPQVCARCFWTMDGQLNIDENNETFKLKKLI